MFVNYNNTTGVLSGVNNPVKFNYVSGVIMGSPAGIRVDLRHTDIPCNQHIRCFRSFARGNLEQTFVLDNHAITSNSIYTIGGSAGKNNLLSGNASNAGISKDYALLSGKNRGSTASLDGSVSGGATIAFNSDFVGFNNIFDYDFKFNFNGINSYLIKESGINLQTFSA